jgi:hypothetical protein
LSEANRRTRKKWAEEYLNWTREQWFTILWTDEIWVNGGRHIKTWVTRLSGEGLDLICVVDKVSKPKGWMFWGCFNGITKGPRLFWEKEWGTIGEKSYCEYIVIFFSLFFTREADFSEVSLIHGCIIMYPELRLMQDGASSYRAKAIALELEERGVKKIFWPPYSPDFNPIETVWDWMKDYIQEQYPQYERDGMSYDMLRKAVKKAWNSISVEQLNELIDSMHQRCQDVIDADGKHTKW